MLCAECGQPAGDEDKYCRRCGTPVPQGNGPQATTTSVDWVDLHEPAKEHRQDQSLASAGRSVETQLDGQAEANTSEPEARPSSIAPDPITAHEARRASAPDGVAAAAWLPDPSGRHELRYWDGKAWTDAVTDRGAQTSSPAPPIASPPYAPPAYGGQQPPHASLAYQSPGYYAPIAKATNGMAIASMVLGILWIYWIGSILALVFGYVALSQIKKRNENGRGMAITGVVLGWVGVGILLLIFVIALVSAIANS
jgi:hypothetical protein